MSHALQRRPDGGGFRVRIHASRRVRTLAHQFIHDITQRDVVGAEIRFTRRAIRHLTQSRAQRRHGDVRAQDASYSRRRQRQRRSLSHAFPRVDVARLVEYDPSLLLIDVDVGLKALRELWTEEQFAQSDVDNPFFAEELALAIKTLSGYGPDQFGG